MSYYIDGIFRLQPKAQFAFQNDDLETLIWLDASIPQPTIEEIKKAAKDYELEQNKAKENLENNRKSAIDKFIDLGLTEEEAKAFLG